MKRVFTGGMFFTLSLLIIGALSAGAAGTPSALPGDADQDGAISCNEAKQRATDRHNSMDANQDGSITMGEFEAGTTKNFEAMDSDKNGMVDVKEYVVFWCGAPPKEAKTSKKSTHGGKHSLHKKMDSNRNGKVTGDECLAFWTVRFAEIDGNKDASIAKDEFGNKVVEWYSETDVNKDGSLTLTENTDYWVGTCQAEKMKKALSAH
jgi:Ca2+-binding EF-hand superfamily protein